MVNMLPDGARYNSASLRVVAEAIVAVGLHVRAQPDEPSCGADL